MLASDPGIIAIMNKVVIYILLLYKLILVKTRYNIPISFVFFFFLVFLASLESRDYDGTCSCWLCWC